MAMQFGSAAYWRARAEETRGEARRLHNPETKRAMVAVAENYEKMALAAEAKTSKRHLTPGEC